MAMSKEQARQEVSQLVDRYRSLTSQAIKQHSEADTRRIFIMPLFQALGWDVYSREEVAEEVKAGTGRVDYVLKLRGVSQFYLEAKKLRTELATPEYVKQAITYAYNRGLTWAVITSFEGLRIYNAQTGRLFINLSCDGYLEHFDDLWLLSRESLESNALEERAQRYGALPPRLGVERRLFTQMREWREKLFTRLCHHNPGLSLDQVDEAIQKLFNRLIFIRTCEDRRIEDKVLLGGLHEWRACGRKGELIDVLRRAFRDFDGYYDSDLFALHLVDDVFIEGAMIEDVINGLYEVPSGTASYDFSLIDTDVLGAVYEQYLGHVATVAKQRAEKAQMRMDLGFAPEATYELTAKKQRRKEQGIYYTPKFITEYIVKQTVGRYLEKHSHDEILKLRVLDPACGSGSFLIRAYDELLNYHAYRSGKPPSQLDQWERLPILIRNIFGVDLDAQAVEIASLNLLLRSLARREILPSLADNIRQGNSLISGTEEELKGYFGDSWQDKNPFNWEQEFEDIMAEGGFDVVIGNPPYLRPHKLEAGDKQALWAQYEVYRAKSDIYACFIQRAITLLKPGGYASYIVSSGFLSLESFAPLRKYILDNCCIMYLGLTPKKVFADATVETIVLGMRKEVDERIRRQNRILITRHIDGAFQRTKEIPQEAFYSTHLNIFDLSCCDSAVSVFSRMESDTQKLSDSVGFCYGLKTGDDSMFLTLEGTTDEHKKLLRRSDFGRYSTDYKGEFVWYVPDQMRAHRSTARPGTRERFETPKLLVQDIGRQLIATLDDEGYYVKDALMLHQKRNGLSLEFVLALIYSKLLDYWYAQRFATLSVAKNAILQLPICRIDLTDPAERRMHDDLVALADKMLELNKRLALLRDKPCNERDELVRDIERTDKAIDSCVYDLYGLTEEERRIIEEV